MSKQVPWNKIILERFIELSTLTKEEEQVIRTRVAGLTITEQSILLGMSPAKVSRITKRLKVLYDNVEKYDPILPPRKFSAKETYQDHH